MTKLVAYQVEDYSLPIVPAPARRQWMSETRGGAANRCLPLLIANQSGWLVLNRMPVAVMWTGGAGRDALRAAYGRWPRLVVSHFGHGILTWNIPYLFRTPPGFNLLVRGPANSPKDAIHALDAVVETDWASATFTMNWKFTRPFTPVVFERNEPICMIVPQRRGELESFEPEVVPLRADGELTRRHREWSTSRAIALGRLQRQGQHPPSPRWELDYFRGRHVSGEPAEDHQTRLRLRKFVKWLDSP